MLKFFTVIKYRPKTNNKSLHVNLLAVPSHQKKIAA